MTENFREGRFLSYHEKRLPLTGQNKIHQSIRPAYDPEKYTTVKKTSDKGAIKWMQKKLNELTPGTNIEVDGIWDKMTTAQLKRYWKRLGWSTAGSYCGKKTCKALYANRKK